jgi:hypothetical protein
MGADGPCGFSAAGCECGARGDDGHAYYVSCSSSDTPQCTRFVDGVAVGHSGATCSFSACGFPVSMPF